MPPTVRQRTLRAAKVQMFQDMMLTRANHASLNGQKDLFTLGSKNYARNRRIATRNVGRWMRISPVLSNIRSMIDGCDGVIHD